MAKLADMKLEELYARKVTSTVAVHILSKDDFTKRSTNWCEKVCTLNCKNPPSDAVLVPKDEVDVLIIQDYQAIDDIKWNKPGERIEQKNRSIIEHISKLGLGSEVRYSVTNLLKCRITRADIKKGKPPTDAVISKCKPYVLEEIRQRKPKVIISLSTSVTKVLGLKMSNYNERGEITRTPDGIPVVITLHPRILTMLRQNSSGKFWGPDFYSVILRDFQKAAKLLSGDLRVPDLDAAIEREKRNIYIARSIEDVEVMTRHLLELGKELVLSYDTETNSLDPYGQGSKIITAQFGFRDSASGAIKSYVFPLWHRENKWYDATAAWELIKPILLDSGIKKIGHNIKFDVLFTAATTGVRLSGILFDTMLLMHHINSGLQGMYGLKKAVFDWIPESELGGYEDKLPGLTKQKKDKSGEDGVESSDEEETFEGGVH